MIKISHAYIIESNNIEKLIFLAKKFIKKITCENNDNCIKCNNIDNGLASNILYIDGFNNKIKNEDIKIAKEFTSYKNNNDYKIVVLHGFEYATRKAANAFLKHLEEPYEKVIFILTTVSKNLILSTILSRCIDVLVEDKEISITSKYEAEILLIKQKKYWDINWENFDKKNISDFLITLSQNIDISKNGVFVKGVLNLINQIKFNVTHDLILAKLFKLCEEMKHD